MAIFYSTLQKKLFIPRIFAPLNFLDSLISRFLIVSNVENAIHITFSHDGQPLTLFPLGYFEDLSPLGGGWFGPPLRSRQLMDRLTRKLAQS